MSKKERKYVFIPIKPDTRDTLNALKLYGDTYDSVVQDLIQVWTASPVEALRNILKKNEVRKLG
jgi:hypothetical protein